MCWLAGSSEGRARPFAALCLLGLVARSARAAPVADAPLVEPLFEPPALVAVSVPEFSASAAAAPEPRPAPLLPSPWPEIAAVVPGVLVHGSGVWLQGRTETAQRLLLLEGSAVLAVLASGFVLFRTGAARSVVGPAALGAVAGVSTLGTSFLANLYSTWAPPAGWGEAEKQPALLESALGYQYVYDPQFDFRHFLTTRLDGFVAGWHLAAAAAYAPGQDNQRVELSAGYRVLGPGALEARAVDGTYVEPRLEYAEHHFDASGFLSRVLGLQIEGRLDLSRLLPDVRGAYFQWGAGWARQWFSYDLPGVEDVDLTSLLLAHAGFGVYLGRRPQQAEPTGGEIELYYDHRHDGFAGGLKVRGLGSGPAGHFGLRGDYDVSARWGVRAQAQLGSAWVLGLGLLYRAGLP